jgi:hypothetical protein
MVLPLLLAALLCLRVMPMIIDHPIEMPAMRYLQSGINVSMDALPPLPDPNAIIQYANQTQSNITAFILQLNQSIADSLINSPAFKDFFNVSSQINQLFAQAQTLTGQYSSISSSLVAAKAKMADIDATLSCFGNSSCPQLSSTPAPLQNCTLASDNATVNGSVRTLESAYFPALTTFVNGSCQTRLNALPVDRAQISVYVRFVIIDGNSASLVINGTDNTNLFNATVTTSNVQVSLPTTSAVVVTATTGAGSTIAYSLQYSAVSYDGCRDYSTNNNGSNYCGDHGICNSTLTGGLSCACIDCYTPPRCAVEQNACSTYTMCGENGFCQLTNKTNCNSPVMCNCTGGYSGNWCTVPPNKMLNREPLKYFVKV